MVLPLSKNESRPLTPPGRQPDRLGTRNESRGIISSVHTPTFNIDENALELGAGLMSWLAVRELQKA